MVVLLEEANLGNSKIALQCDPCLRPEHVEYCTWSRRCFLLQLRSAKSIHPGGCVRQRALEGEAERGAVGCALGDQGLQQRHAAHGGA
jgi:hypothetical protein